jgi:hypothetical protein
MLFTVATKIIVRNALKTNIKETVERRSVFSKLQVFIIKYVTVVWLEPVLYNLTVPSSILNPKTDYFN